MKLRKRLSLLRRKSKVWLNQKGQTLVEFVLLLAVVSTISYAFVAFINGHLGTYWEHCVNLVVNDNDPNKPKKRIE